LRNCRTAWAACGLAALLPLAVRAQGEADSRPGPNLALGCAVTFDTPPNNASATDPDDVHQLVDGKLSPATPIWYDKSAVGWLFTDPTVLTLDLGSVHPIRGVGLHMGAGQAGVEWPASFHLYVSDDGDRFSYVGDLMRLLTVSPPEQGYAALWLSTDRLQTHGRYVRFVGSPVNRGNGAYIMLDEVEVYGGDAAWLDRPLVWPAAPARWSVPWREVRWRDQADAMPASEKPRRVVLIDGEAEAPDEGPLQQISVTEGGATFTLRGEAGRPRRMSWTGELPSPISTANCRYAALTFRAEGVRPTPEATAVVAVQGVNDRAGASAVTLLDSSAAPDDGLSHTLVTALPEGFTLQQVRVALPTEDDAPHLSIESLELSAAPPDTFGAAFSVEHQVGEGFGAVDLRTALNGRLAEWFERVLTQHRFALDGARLLPPGRVWVSGVPFEVPDGPVDLALLPETPEPNERIEFLGQTIDSRNLGPVSRDDVLSVAVDAQAREVFLLLALCAPPVQVRGGLPSCPLRLDDAECLTVELGYDRGRDEIAFPYSLADRGCYLPARELGAYAVAVDPTRRLKRVALRSHQYGLGFALAGLTLNTSDRALVPELADLPPPQPVPRHPEPPPRVPQVAPEGRRLTLSNRWAEFGFDLSRGFSLTRFANRWAPSAKVVLSPSSGLRVREGDRTYTGRCFEAEVIGTTETEARIRLTSTRPELPLEIVVSLGIGDGPELTLTAEATNRGAQPLAVALCLPALAGFSLAGPAETRLFFPQYRAVDTGENIALRAPYGPEFSLQFMDVYNPRAGIGLMVRTDNREQRMADFVLRKDADGVAGGAYFLPEHDELQPGATRAYPPVALIPHSGDWHEALELYREWVGGWYAPQKSQDESFFLEAWDIQCYRPGEKLSWRDARVPSIISPDRKRFWVDETFAFEQQRLGHVPDLVHFFNWTHNDRLDRDENGVYGGPLAYQQVGGLEFFREGIARIQTHWGRPLSLYTLSDRFRASALPDQDLSRELTERAAYKELEGDASAALRGAGQVDGIIYPQIGEPRWTEYFVRDIVQMQRDTGCRIVYMDVFPRFSHLRGRNGITPREDDLDVVTRMREALPDEVALWSEYPLTDVASQQADGCLQYYFVELNEVFARVYNSPHTHGAGFPELPLNVGRYALPRYRTFCLPGYIEASNRPGQVDAVFVNGEPFHEDTFRLQHSRLRERLNRAYAVKHEYADCFGSDAPVPRVSTAAAGITANLFPGGARQVWTLSSTRPRTFSGVVLRIRHREGARYRDAWNGRDLEPVIRDGMAEVAVTLDPQQVGCVVQDWGQGGRDA
jgi:hypothetical protein